MNNHWIVFKMRMILLSIFAVLALYACEQEMSSELKCVEIERLNSGRYNDDIYVSVLINDKPLKLYTNARRISVVTVGQFIDITYNERFVIKDFNVAQNCSDESVLHK